VRTITERMIIFFMVGCFVSVKVGNFHIPANVVFL